uniref:C-type lectin domain-containing protein n=1 Tax=Xiphophorus maculatus TaxID=8083 RepID=A0A3B5RCV6_XIPMA
IKSSVNVQKKTNSHKSSRTIFFSVLGQYCVIVCQEKHTDLATVTNMKDMKRLINILPRDWRGAWIGLYYQTDGTRKWHWSDPGLEFNESETNWNPGEPNDANGWQNCGFIWKSLKWGDLSCNDPRYFLCYDVILIKENKTWKDALTYCRGHHDDLVTITNMDDQRWIQEKVKEASTPFVWLGLRFNCFKNIWFWVCKEKISYQNSTSAGWMNNCNTSGAMQAGGEHRWFQRNDTEELNFICSKV